MKRACIVLLSLSLAACAAAPKRDLDLERLRSEWRALDNPADRQRAPLEADRVDEALRGLQQLQSRDPNERKHYADLAELRMEIYSATAAAAREGERLEQLEDERKSILLEASRRDAELARLEAEKLRLQSLARAEEAERLRAENDSERARSAEVAAEADLARQEALAARRLAETRTREAELARMEAELSAQQALSLKQQIAALRPVSDARGMKLTLGDVFFASGQSLLKAEAKLNLGPVLDFINRYPGHSVLIEGHTDDRGAEAANQTLSEARAEAVRAALVGIGADAARLKVTGAGETQPIADNGSAEGRARNRRVEVIVEGAR